MENKDEPAYPIPAEVQPDFYRGHDVFVGLTKREWFAGMAMQGLLMGNRWKTKELVEEAFTVADAMLERLND